MGGCAMRLVDRIRELCATAANTNDPVTAFQALQELREITRVAAIGEPSSGKRLRS